MFVDFRKVFKAKDYGTMSSEISALIIKFHKTQTTPTQRNKTG